MGSHFSHYAGCPANVILRREELKPELSGNISFSNAGKATGSLRKALRAPPPLSRMGVDNPKSRCILGNANTTCPCRQDCIWQTQRPQHSILASLAPATLGIIVKRPVFDMFAFCSIEDTVPSVSRMKHSRSAATLTLCGNKTDPSFADAARTESRPGVPSTHGPGQWNRPYARRLRSTLPAHCLVLMKARFYPPPNAFEPQFLPRPVTLHQSASGLKTPGLPP